MSQKSFNFFELVGKTIVATTAIEAGVCAFEFTLQDGSRVTLYHNQDCCEQVRVYDIKGDPNKILGKQIVLAEEDNPCDHPSVGDMSGSDSHTITVFTLKTVDGSELEIVWLGESNGYYDESVSISIHKDTP